MPKGVKYGGRQKGTPNKTTLERSAAIAAAERKDGRKLGIDILVEGGNQCWNLAMAYAPHRERQADDKFPADERKFEKYMAMSIDAAGKVVKFQTPALQSTTLRHDAPTEPIKVEIEIV